jgi:hypothetical protein
MMKRSTLAAAALMALAAFAPLATLGAQGIVSLGLGGGMSIPQGGYGDIADAGWNALATLAVNVPLLPIGVRVDGMYNHFNVTTGTGASLSGSEHVSSFTVNPVLRFQVPFSPVTPYAIAGGGSYSVGCSGGIGCASQTHFGWNAGGGVRLGLLGVNAFAEARFHRVSVGGATVQYVPITVGLLF